ncbi:MAG: hypothetical protein ABI599_17210 [Flavobacteriales bacterium]
MKNATAQALASVLLVAACSLFHTSLRAQLEYIPDPWLRGWMNQLAPGCVDAAGYLDPNHPALDTVHTAYLNTNTLDLTGIEHLHHIKDLTIQCNGAGVVTPVLPDSLERLTLQGFGFTGPIQLFAPLHYFNGGWPNDSWESTLIGPFPATLDTLLFFNGIGGIPLALPSLPNGLRRLAITSDLLQLDSLPPMLGTLQLMTNSTICLPSLPAEMDHLELSYGSVACLPNLPFVADPAELILPPFLQLCDPNSPCIYGPGLLSGHIWHDLDNDGVQDIGEGALPSDAVMVSPWGMVGAMPDGVWRMPLDTGTYTVTPLPANPYLSSVSPTLLTASITTGAPVDSLNDFAYQLTPGMTDVALDLTLSQAHPGFFSWWDVSLLNLGSEIASGTLTVQLDPGVQYESTWPYPATVNGNTLEWTVNNLAIGENRHFTIEVQIPFNLLPGALVTCTATMQTTATDLDPSNNTSAAQTLVLAAWDPNDKLVEPSTATPAEVALGKELTYTIRFQNTGNYPAARVIITDTLSSLLDPMSMSFMSSSHPCSWSLLRGVLTFLFDPIYLPDSSADQIGSQGYAKFKLTTVPSLALGDEVRNVANIFFDVNLPVVTAPALFRVEQATGIADIGECTISISPMLTQGPLQVNLNGSWMRSTELFVYDLSGKRVLSGALQNAAGVLDLSELPSGVYTIEALDGVHRSVGRAIKE